MGETWTEVYTRCMDGEFFRGEFCPLDGHSSETSAWVEETVAQLRAEGVSFCLEELDRRGFDGNPADLIVVEFRSQADAPDWLRPDG